MNPRASIYTNTKVGTPVRSNTINQSPYKIVVAIEDYDAENHREISFKQGNTLKLYFSHKNVEYWKAEFEGQIGYFPKRAIKVDWELVDDKDEKILDMENEQKRYDLLNQFMKNEEEYVEDLKTMDNVNNFFYNFYVSK